MDGWVPLYVRPRGRRVVVFGGGVVAERRARLFAEAGARVDVYALDFTRGLQGLASQGLVRLHEADLRRVDLDGILDGAWLAVVAVSDPALAHRLAEEAGSRGVLVNNAVKAVEGDVIVPYRGCTDYGVCLSSTSHGRAGVAARRSLEACLRLLQEDPYYRGLYMVMAWLKEELKRRVPDPAARLRGMLAADSDEDLHRLIREGRLAEARERALLAALEAAENPGGD